MNIYDIMRKYLIDNKYTGLFNDDGCGCNLDDFMPCGGECILNCKAGYANDCFTCVKNETCEEIEDVEIEYCCCEKKCWKGV